MTIEYIFRHRGRAFSIEKVFDSVIGALAGHDDVTVCRSEVRKIGFWPVMLLYNMIRYGVRSRANRIFHITGDVQYLGCTMNPRNTVLTIHDLVPLRNERVPWHSRKLCYWLWYYIPLKRLNHITCISETTKRDLLAFFPWAADKVTVICDPVDDAFEYSRKDFDSACPRILHIGTKSNKNLERVAEALKGLKCHLRVVGNLSSGQKSNLERNGIDYSDVSGISDEQIVAEYEMCDMVSFPSLFEGFGMPIVEGQRVGRAVVTSDIEPMRSVAGGAAVYVDPTSVESIRQGFEECISNECLRTEIIAAGLENAERYSARNIANNYCELYESILN